MTGKGVNSGEGELAFSGAWGLVATLDLGHTNVSHSFILRSANHQYLWCANINIGTLVTSTA